MERDQFYDRIRENLSNQLPTVVYRKPNSSTIQAILPPTNALQYVVDYNEEGFVFAAFDKNQAPLLITGEHISCNQEETTTITHVTENNTHEDNTARNLHIDRVKKAIAYIKDSHLKKVVLSRKQIIPIKTDRLALFKQLEKTYKSAMTYLFYHPKVGTWLGATPETLVQFDANKFSTMALAGTQPFTGKMNLEWGEKEKQEQQFVVDEILERLSLIPQLRPKASPRITHQAGNVMHLLTKITGTFPANEVNLKDLIHKLHPTAAVCGLPRELAKSYIDELEDYDREFYTGFLGELNLKNINTRNPNKKNIENSAYFTLKRQSTLFVNLRCMQIKDNEAIIYVGGGITEYSNPVDEWLETVNKAQTMVRILQGN